MWIAKLDDYEVLDCSGGEKLERFGKYKVIRPDPQVIWNTEKDHPDWAKPDGRYIRSDRGGGRWEIYSLPQSFDFHYGELKMRLKPMNFKHTGVFPEQTVNWDFAMDKIRGAGREINVLNLFAYTGGMTLACAAAGAKTVHVDASKGIVAMAKANAAMSGLGGASIRYIVDDCMKFVARELRRGNKYDAIILDPPSYGRGPGGEVWKLEDKLYEFLNQLSLLLSDNPLFFILNSYTTGFSAMTMAALLDVTVLESRKGIITADELGLPVKDKGISLPCGSTARIEF